METGQKTDLALIAEELRSTGVAVARNDEDSVAQGLLEVVMNLDWVALMQLERGSR